MLSIIHGYTSPYFLIIIIAKKRKIASPFFCKNRAATQQPCLHIRLHKRENGFVDPVGSGNHLVNQGLALGAVVVTLFPPVRIWVTRALTANTLMQFVSQSKKNAFLLPSCNASWRSVIAVRQS